MYSLTVRSLFLWRFMKILTEVVRMTRPKAALSATHGVASRQGTKPPKWKAGMYFSVKGRWVAMAPMAAMNLRTQRTATTFGASPLPSVTALAAAMMKTATEMARCSSASYERGKACGTKGRHGAWWVVRGAWWVLRGGS